jgi:putative membrane protein
MLPQALGAWLHFIAIFSAVACLAAERALYRPALDAASAQRLTRLDLGYGLSAVAILLTGLARVFWLGKGAAFYGGNPLFWAKLAVFAVVALLSLPPTVHYLRWRPALAAGQAPQVHPAAYRRVRALLWCEALGFLLLPLLAALMARGIGS